MNHIKTDLGIWRETNQLTTRPSEAVAYIDADDELTIYLWGGKPVAYLERDTGNEFHVYGFSGKHLGWFVVSFGITREMLLAS